MGLLLVLVVTTLTPAVLSAFPPGQDATIRGTVVLADRPDSPVRRALVTVSSPALDASRTTISDDEGRFYITGLPSGSYRVIATKAGYVTSAAGALRPARVGVPILIRAGEATSDVTIRMWRAGVIAGLVLDERGTPVSGLSMRAYPVAPEAKAYPTLDNNGVVTDREGRFRLFGLEPGEYLLAALPPSATLATASQLRDDYVDHMLAQLARGLRGRALNQGNVGVVPVKVVFSPIYYPGTGNHDEATKIVVKAGEETLDVRVTWTALPAATVRGHVLFPDGTPATGATVRMTAARSPTVAAPPSRFGATADSTGGFVVPYVPRGTYDVWASARSPGSGTLWASSVIAASGGDIGPVALQLGPGLGIRGRVRLVRQADQTLVDIPPNASIALVPGTTVVDPKTSLAGTIGGSAIRPDGTFTIGDLKPNDAYRLVVNGLPNEWWPDSARVGGVDLFDGPSLLSLSDSDTPIIVTLSDQPTELWGTLSGDAMPGQVMVVVFPADATLWTIPRRVQATQPEADGRYSFVNLPMGDYLIGVVADVDPDMWRSPAFLNQLRDASVPVTLDRGARRQLDLKGR